jgi:predicted DNA-binding transcriptional regulator AlpA
MNAEVKFMENPVGQVAPLPLSLNKSQFAANYGVCTKTIDRHLEEGICPPPDFYVGRFPHWKISTIENWIETKKRI